VLENIQKTSTPLCFTAIDIKTSGWTHILSSFSPVHCKNACLCVPFFAWPNRFNMKIVSMIIFSLLNKNFINIFFRWNILVMLRSLLEKLVSLGEFQLYEDYIPDTVTTSLVKKFGCAFFMLLLCAFIRLEKP
jgi:hypothetical protein